MNEALAITDALLHCAIEGEASTPPSTPAEGEAWLVAASATGAWEGHDGAIACRQGGNWIFVTPVDGMRVLDRTTGQEGRFHAGWHWPVTPASPSGGATIDAEARLAIAAIIAALRTAGILAAE